MNKKVLSLLLAIAAACALLCSCSSVKKEDVLGTWVVSGGNYDYYQFTFKDDGTVEYYKDDPKKYNYTPTADWTIKGKKIVISIDGKTLTDLEMDSSSRLKDSTGFGTATYKKK